MHDWKTIRLTRDFLEGVRGGIPMATTQIELILRLIHAWKPDPETIVDLGCGDGILGRYILEYWPGSKGIFIDYSEPMLQAAREKGKPFKSRTTYYLLDFGDRKWKDSFRKYHPVDVVVSGFSIHHLEDDKKLQVYRDIFSILKPGGIFLNLEHVASQDTRLEKMFDEVFIDGLFEFHQNNNSSLNRQEISDKYYNREDKILNKLTLVESQCQWLREIGFQNVDCYFKLFEIALFGGCKP